MRNKLLITIEESNLKFNLYYKKSCIDNCFNKVADLIYNDFQNLHPERYIIAIAGPPGCGKSSIAHLLNYLLKNNFNLNTTILPLDGFHHKNNYLQSNRISIKNRVLSLYDIKGAPETYNLESFINSLKKLINGENFYWPIYSRKIHNPIEKGIKITDDKSIFIIEGNYLLLDELPWKELTRYYNKKIFISSSLHFLKKRIIKRKLAGGHSRKEAVKHYKISDRENIKRVLNNTVDYDILIKQRGKYYYTLKMIK